MCCQNKGKIGKVAQKLDISKEFDSVNWKQLRNRWALVVNVFPR